MDFWEIYSPFLFHDLQWPSVLNDVKAEFEKQFSLLRKGILYVMRYHEGQHTAHRIREARDTLLQYAARVQKVHKLRYIYILSSQQRVHFICCFDDAPCCRFLMAELAVHTSYTCL